MCRYALILVVFFFFKQKTAYEMRISDWSSDVCSSDLRTRARARRGAQELPAQLPRILREALVRTGRGADGPYDRDRRRDGSVRHRSDLRGARSAALREIGSASCRERVCQYV